MNGFETLLRRERWIITFGLAVICVLSWAYIASGAGTGMNSGAMTTWEFPPPVGLPSMENHWGASYWFIMLAMIVPSAAPDDPALCSRARTGTETK